MPHVAQSAPWHTWEPVQELGLPAWADDFTHLQVAVTSEDLLDRVVRSTELLVRQATCLGMILTFAVDKTATLLTSNCIRQGSRHVSKDDQGSDVLKVRDTLTGITHCMPIVDAYRHLGSITVANSTPEAEIRFRVALANGMLRPLARKLFSDCRVPLGLRRTFLHSLVMSRFMFASATLSLHALQHRRTWCRQYVLLLRGLIRWKDKDDCPHSYKVLQEAAAPSPLLALAQARAGLLSRMLARGPGALLHLLHAHWRQAPSKSWLGMFLLDLRAVAVYVPAAAALLRMPCPVTALIEAVQDSLPWWKARVKQAVARFSEDLAAWRPRDAPRPAAPPCVERPYTCEECGDAFVLRKHLCVHLARRHGQLSPARHFAPLPVCLACLRHFHSVRRVQGHLKHSTACLTRLLHVLPPLSVPEISEAESADVAAQRKLRQGHWGAYSAAQPVLPSFGPRHPIYAEVVGDEDLDLARLSRIYRPSPTVVDWVMKHIAGASVEGARESAQEFWLQRPTSVSPF